MEGNTLGGRAILIVWIFVGVPFHGGFAVSVDEIGGIRGIRRGKPKEYI